MSRNPVQMPDSPSIMSLNTTLFIGPPVGADWRRYTAPCPDTKNRHCTFCGVMSHTGQSADSSRMMCERDARGFEAGSKQSVCAVTDDVELMRLIYRLVTKF